VQRVPLLVEEEVAARGRVLHEEALLPLGAHDVDHVVELRGRAREVHLGRAAVGPLLHHVLEDRLVLRADHLGVIGVLPGLVFRVVAPLARL
jgi:hypothetical protein